MGLLLQYDLAVVAAYGIVDLALRLHELNEEALGTFLNPPPGIRFVKRALAWFTIGLLRGAFDVMFDITFRKQHEGTEWQFWPMLAVTLNRWAVDIGLTCCGMLRIHADSTRTVLWWWMMVNLTTTISWAGSCSPYLLITYIANCVYFLVTMFGLTYVIKFADRDCRRDDVKQGYKFLSGLIAWGGINFTLRVASAELPEGIANVGALVKSAMLMLFSFLALRLVIPAAKMAFGDDPRKLWSFFIPQIFLGLEIGQCTLFLGSNLGDWQFWYVLSSASRPTRSSCSINTCVRAAHHRALIVMHEANSFLRNTGLYLKSYIAVRDMAGIPASEMELRLMEERRSVIAPCGKCVSVKLISASNSF